MEKQNNDSDWDKKLKIHTTGREDAHADIFHHPYEPTPYSVLQRLAESGYITKENTVVDYGCGKGRVSLFLSHYVGCHAVGIEYDEGIYKQAVQNLEESHLCNKVTFLCQKAEEYEVPQGDCFYFFNPFRVELLCSVLSRILDSYYANPRKMRLFFYYPDDEYLSYLLVRAADRVDFVDEIDCSDLFEGENARERILIFEVGELFFAT